ncbi:MAG: hypothetical protein ABJD13_18245 [Paracoccaceae bacterium]
MKRRNFLKAGVGGAVLSPVVAPAIAQSSRSARLLTAHPEAAQALSNRLSALGVASLNLEIETVAATDESSLLDRVSSGDGDLCLASLDKFWNTSPAYSLFASIPFGMSSAELESWVSVSEGRDMLDQLGNQAGLRFWFASDYGGSPIWMRKAIAGMQDVASSSIGSSGIGLKLFQAMGASNVVDITDQNTNWSGLDIIEGASLAQMQNANLLSDFQFVSESNPVRPSAILSLGANEAFAAGLSEAELLILQRACSAQLALSRSTSFYQNALAVSEGQSSAKVVEMPADVWSGINSASQNILTEIFNSGKDEASIVDAYIYFLTDAVRWSNIGEAAYYAGRKRLFANLAGR